MEGKVTERIKLLANGECIGHAFFDIVLFTIKKEFKIEDGIIEDPYERVFGLKEGE